MRRIFIFGLVNALVLVTLSIAWTIASSVLGLPATYYNYIIMYGVVFGFGGAFVSLLMSKWIAKSAMGVRIIPADTNDPALRRVVQRVHEFARGARLPKMPEVGIYNSPEVNAFATGPSKGNALVAVSTGLLQNMDSAEVDGVLGHEVAHIANGDMVTMTLVQGVMNAVALILARLLAMAVESAITRDREGSYGLRMVLTLTFEMLFGFLAFFVVSYFSRAREFRADSGGAKLAGRENMIAALKRLQRTTTLVSDREQAMQTLKISGRTGGSLMRLLSTHPPLEERIRRLETGR